MFLDSPAGFSLTPIPLTPFPVGRGELSKRGGYAPLSSISSPSPEEEKGIKGMRSSVSGIMCAEAVISSEINLSGH